MSPLVFNQRVLARIGRRLAARNRAKLHGSSPRKAAVLVPLCNVNGKASCLFTKRTEEVGTHKGQVSFPGGHVDAGETATEAACRELEEELGGGVPCDVLGKFDDALAITGTHVTPVVGFMQEDLTDMSVFQLSEAEVDFAFTLPIERMLDPAFVAVETLSNRPRVANSRATAQVPVFRGGPARVWGLTAWIMSEVLQNVVVPSFVEDEQLLKEDAARLQELLGKAAHPPNE